MENLPNLRELFLTEKLDFNLVFKLRHSKNAKYYRKWINEVGENWNAEEVSREYINEIQGGKKFFERTEGKLLKALALFGMSSLLGSAIMGPAGLILGGTMGLLETFWLDNILKGKNPSMFIKDVEMEIKR